MISLTAVQSSLSPSYHQLSVGLELLPVKEAIVYTQYWPISYKIPFPQTVDHKFVLSCDPLRNSKLCSPFLMLTNALNNFTAELNALHFFNNEPPSPLRNERSLLPFLGDFMHFLIGTTTDNQLENFRLNFKEVTRHIQNLEAHEQGIHTTFSNFSHAITRLANESRIAFADVKTAMKNILDHENSIFSTLFNSSNQMQNFITFLLQLDTHFVNNLQHFLSHYSYHTAYFQCNQNRLPRSLIAPSILQSDLTLLRTKLRVKNLTISPTFSIQTAYDLPITSCVYTDTHILVHVKIPLIPLSTTPGLFHLLSFPLAAENETCNLQLNTTYAIITSDSVFPLSTNDFKLCNISPKPFLCKIPNILNINPVLTNCLFTLQQATVVGQLHDSCPIFCTPDHPFSIKSIKDDTYALINPPPQLSLQFPNNTIISLNFSSFHNVYLTLPCGHALLSSNTVIIRPPTLCFSYTTKPHVIQLHHALTIQNLLFPIPTHRQILLNSSFNGIPLSFNSNISHPQLTPIPDIPPPSWLNLIPEEHESTIYSSVLSLQFLLTVANTICLIILYRRLNNSAHTNVTIATEMQPLNN